MGASLLLALGLSLDGLGVGLSYGLRRIRIPFGPMLMVSLCSIAAMGSSMLLGKNLLILMPYIPTRLAGAFILIGIGGVHFIRAFKNTNLNQNTPTGVLYDKPIQSQELTSIVKIHLRPFGVIIQILRSPNLADLDGSGTISYKESILLGSALAMDTLVAGIGAVLSGMSFMVIFIVALMQFVLMNIGLLLTDALSEKTLKKAKFLPGTLLIVLGLGKLI